MHRPFIHRAIEVRPVGPNRFAVFSNEHIGRGTRIEACAIIPITKQAHTALTKTRTSAADKLVQNPDGILKERNILNSIAEMELEKRFDAGLVSTEDIKKILFESGNLTQVLDIETHGFLSGYGSFYSKSQYPNALIEYDAESKLYNVTTVKDITPNTEITYFTR
jgi:hypothetical protein